MFAELKKWNAEFFCGICGVYWNFIYVIINLIFQIFIINPIIKTIKIILTIIKTIFVYLEYNIKGTKDARNISNANTIVNTILFNN